METPTLQELWWRRMEVSGYFFCCGSLILIMGITVNRNLEWCSSPSGNGKQTSLACSIIYCTLTLRRAFVELHTSAWPTKCFCILVFKKRQFKYFLWFCVRASFPYISPNSHFSLQIPWCFPFKLVDFAIPVIIIRGMDLAQYSRGEDT